jgi:chromosome segregation ATPase
MADFLGGNSNTASGRNHDVNYGAANSESERIKAAQVARKKSEKMRADQKLSEARRLHEHNRLELLAKNNEIRRLTQEIFHADSEIRQIESGLKIFAGKESESGIRVHNFESQLRDKQTEAVKMRKGLEDKRREEVELEAKLVKLQRELAEVRKFMTETDRGLKALDLEVRHIEGAMHKHQSETAHTESEEAYKKKEIDNKKKAMYALEQKKQRQEAEIVRLVNENKSLESQIQSLEQLAK